MKKLRKFLLAFFLLVACLARGGTGYVTMNCPSVDSWGYPLATYYGIVFEVNDGTGNWVMFGLQHYFGSGYDAAPTQWNFQLGSGTYRFKVKVARSGTVYMDWSVYGTITVPTEGGTINYTMSGMPFYKMDVEADGEHLKIITGQNGGQEHGPIVIDGTGTGSMDCGQMDPSSGYMRLTVNEYDSNGELVSSQTYTERAPSWPAYDKMNAPSSTGSTFDNPLTKTKQLSDWGGKGNPNSVAYWTNSDGVVISSSNGGLAVDLSPLISVVRKFNADYNVGHQETLAEMRRATNTLGGGVAGVKSSIDTGNNVGTNLTKGVSAGVWASSNLLAVSTNMQGQSFRLAVVQSNIMVGQSNLLVAVTNGQASEARQFGTNIALMYGVSNILASATNNLAYQLSLLGTISNINSGMSNLNYVAVTNQSNGLWYAKTLWEGGYNTNVMQMYSNSLVAEQSWAMQKMDESLVSNINIIKGAFMDKYMTLDPSRGGGIGAGLPDVEETAGEEALWVFHVGGVEIDCNPRHSVFLCEMARWIQSVFLWIVTGWILWSKFNVIKKALVDIQMTPNIVSSTSLQFAPLGTGTTSSIPFKLIFGLIFMGLVSAAATVWIGMIDTNLMRTLLWNPFSGTSIDGAGLSSGLRMGLSVASMFMPLATILNLVSEYIGFRIVMWAAVARLMYIKSISPF